MAATLPPPLATPLGSPIPALLPHAISVSLPTWRDNVGYEEGESRVMDRMQNGYPRFFIHRSIQKLQKICLAKFGSPETEACMLFPSPRVAKQARKFLSDRPEPVQARIVEFVICPSTSSLVDPQSSSAATSTDDAAVGGVDCIELQILLYPAAAQSIAKQFWQHTGDGISSRTADRALAFMGERPAPGLGELLDPPKAEQGSSDAAGATVAESAQLGKNARASYSRNRHYSKAPVALKPAVAARPSGSSSSAVDDSLSLDHSVYLEERYGRNLPLSSAKLAKLAMRRRIAGVLLPHEKAAATGAGSLSQLPRGSSRHAPGQEKIVTEDDVYLYATGMSAIWHAHELAMTWKARSGGTVGKSVCFGFPYTDTLKILQKWGPGCHFFGHGHTEDLDALSDLLAKSRAEANEPPILALFCEFPSNPLLRSPDLKRLRALADEYGFLIVVDETIGNFVNVEVASWADVVVSSLTKVFSGDTNVMGGALVIPPQSQHHAELKAALSEVYEDNYFAEDAIYLERNSRDFRTRVAAINDNAYELTEYLEKRSHDASCAIKDVFYPRFMTPENYAIAQRLPSTGKGGYGGLFAVTFKSMSAAEAFFDNLDCCKGPSLGTNFTLVCPYTIIAHYYELEWASGYGVDSSLVRISVGLEDIEALKVTFGRALEAADKAYLAAQK